MFKQTKLSYFHCNSTAHANTTLLKDTVKHNMERFLLTEWHTTNWPSDGGVGHAHGGGLVSGRPSDEASADSWLDELVTVMADDEPLAAAVSSVGDDLRARCDVSFTMPQRPADNW